MHDRRVLTPLSLLLLASCGSDTPVDPDARGRELAQEVLIVDGHIDVPIRLWAQKRREEPVDDVTRATDGGEFDWPRAVEGGLDAPFFSIYTPASSEDDGTSKQMAVELCDMIDGIVASAPEKFTLAKSVADVEAAFAADKIAILLGMENGSPIEGDLANLDYFHERGVRYITLCHSKDNHICDSSYDDRRTHGGLTDFGREVVARMNDLGIMIDVSHVSDDSFWQIMDITRAPVVASHSSLRQFLPGFERNMSDEMVLRLAENGGVVQINFGSTFVTDAARTHGDRRRAAVAAFCEENGVERRSDEARAFLATWNEENPFPFATVQDVADHVDRVVELVGVEHVGFGSDFDGVGDTLPRGLEDVSKYPNLLAELLRRGYSESDLELICGGNVMRVFAAVEAVAAES